MPESRPLLAALILLQRLRIRGIASYVNALITTFAEQMLAAPDPLHFSSTHSPYFLALIRAKGHLRRQARSLDRQILPLHQEFESQPKTRATAQNCNGSNPLGKETSDMIQPPLNTDNLPSETTILSALISVHRRPITPSPQPGSPLPPLPDSPQTPCLPSPICHTL